MGGNEYKIDFLKMKLCYDFNNILCDDFDEITSVALTKLLFNSMYGILYQEITLELNNEIEDTL